MIAEPWKALQFAENVQVKILPYKAELNFENGAGCPLPRYFRFLQIPAYHHNNLIDIMMGITKENIFACLSKLSLELISFQKDFFV